MHALLTIRESHDELELAVFPDRLLLSWNTALPDLQVKHSLGIPLRLRIKAKWMVLTPLLPEDESVTVAF